VLLRGSISQQQQTGSKATKQASLRTILCQPTTSIDGRATESQQQEMHAAKLALKSATTPRCACLHMLLESSSAAESLLPHNSLLQLLLLLTFCSSRVGNC